ncbi:MAG: hypothetical protein KC486_25640 [Myxococcales bacterium]|nr:hypothetical protein [Myxococcales bacterium]
MSVADADAEADAEAEADADVESVVESVIVPIVADADAEPESVAVADALPESVADADADADADSVPLPSVVLAVSLPDAVSSPLHAQRPTTLSAATPEINRFHVSSIPNLTRLTLGPALGSEKGFHERPGEKDVS